MSGSLAFFGAFNPPTVAHLELARFAMEATGRDLVIFVPSQSVYIRGTQGKDFAYSDHQRAAMLQACAENRPWMRICDWELCQPRQPRTYETLCHLRDEGQTPALLLGSDKLPELKTGWRYVEEIAREFGIVCLARGQDNCRSLLQNDPYLRALSPFIHVLESPGKTRNISSTAVRRLVVQRAQLLDELGQLVCPEIISMIDPQEGHKP